MKRSQSELQRQHSLASCHALLRFMRGCGSVVFAFFLSLFCCTHPAFGAGIPGLSLIWPLTPQDGSAVTQDYAHFNRAREDLHHTGLDIGASSDHRVWAAASGHIVKIQEN